ncbi:hypothetical protein ABIB25_005039 [Nakamurella sp. UYEF19]|uniref:hypothetical protein n=1 Tax=Nakamurella sp. UYEF19 TaxID=1756392 RepID=UPI003394DC3A
MSGPKSLRWRLLRSSFFALVATWIAALGHLVGGGTAPDPAILIVGALVIGSVGTGLTFRQRTWPAIFGVLALCQLAFHLLFSIDVHAMSGSPMPTIDPLRMLAFHAVAAALSATVLARGDSAIFALFHALTRAVLLLRPILTVDRPPRWTASFPAARSFPAGPLLSTSPRRGPPAF